MSDTGNVTGSHTATLTCERSCGGGDAGSYQVVVTNGPISGVVTSGVAVLTVTDPFISVQPQSHAVLIGSNATFTVTAAGSPTLAYQWKQGGNPLSDGPTVPAGYCRLQHRHADHHECIGLRHRQRHLHGGRIQHGLVRDHDHQRGGDADRAGPAGTGAYVGTGGGSYTLYFSGPGGQTYRVLYSTNVVTPLANWNVLSASSFSGGTDTYTDDTRRPAAVLHHCLAVAARTQLESMAREALSFPAFFVLKRNVALRPDGQRGLSGRRVSPSMNSGMIWWLAGLTRPVWTISSTAAETREAMLSGLTM